MGGRRFCSTYVRVVVIPVLGRSGYGWVVTLDMEHNPATRTVPWTGTTSKRQNTNAWEGTTLTLTLTPAQHHTQLAVAHRGYRESPCYEVCRQGGEYFSGTSLQQYLETGKGMRYPEVQDSRKG